MKFEEYGIKSNEGARARLESLHYGQRVICVKGDFAHELEVGKSYELEDIRDYGVVQYELLTTLKCRSFGNIMFLLFKRFVACATSGLIFAPRS